jgi:N-acetyl-gamma-glutamyl-phosphate reductase
MIRVGVVGATGYTGAELLRLLAGHPQACIEVVTSRTESGRRVADVYPNLRGRLDLAYSDVEPRSLARCEVVFFATPNGTAMQHAPALLGAGVRVIDLAADFRLRDAAQWAHWYGMAHACPQLLAEAVYGLPELHREAIRGARLVANPGCYPTAVALGLLPLVEAGVLAPGPLIADAKSGVSGAGRTARQSLLYAEVTDSFKAYNVFAHRHHPEIVQTLAGVASDPPQLVFVPHLVPMLRGIHATLYARVRDDAADLQALYAERFACEPFVQVLEPGAHPETREVRASNDCRIAVHRQGPQVVVLAVIDNLVKGAAGQAVQNMNLMFGLAETSGLAAPGALP